MEQVVDLFDIEEQLRDAKQLYLTLKGDLNEQYTAWRDKKIKQATGQQAMSEHDAWLFERSLGLGGSDIGALMSLSPYTTRYELWQDKCHGVNEFEGNNFTKWGNMLESVVADNFASEFGLDIEKSPESFAGVNGQHQWLRANIDFDIPNSAMMGEVKTASAESKMSWGTGIEPSDVQISRERAYEIIMNVDPSLCINTLEQCEFPLSYFCQAQYYMMLKNKDYCFLTALIGGNDERHYLITANHEFQDLIYYRATFFMFHNIIKEQPPLKTAFEQMQEYIACDHSGNIEAEEVDGLMDCIKELAALNKKYSDLGKEKRALENKIKETIGEKSKIVREGDELIAWSTQKRVSIDKDALEDLHPDIYEELKKETVLRVLRLNKKNTKEFAL